jgi:hypothetical protein
MLKHIVCWKLKEESKQENLVRMKSLLDSLPPVISEIKEFEVGIDVLKTETSYDITLYSAFEDAAALKRYQVHPAHEEVAGFIKSVTEKRAVVDYLV